MTRAEERAKRGRILVVDDERGLRDLLKDELSRRGHCVRTARDGQAALTVLAAEKFDLVISDIRMPRVGGLQLLEAAKAAAPEIEVILVTGHGTIETAVEAMTRGAYGFVQKPFEMDTLFALVYKALEKSELKAVLGIYHASRSVFRSTRLDCLLPVIVDMTRRILNADEASILLLRGETLEVVATSGGDSLRRGGAQVDVGERVAGRVARLKEPLIIDGPLEQDERFAGVPSLRGIHSSVVCPLVVEDETLGVLCANRIVAAASFSPADLRHLTIFATQAAQAVLNAKTYRRLEEKIAELRVANRRLEESQAELLQADKLAAVGRLAAGVAHEINNPMTGIIAFAQLLLEAQELSPDQREGLNCIHEQGQRCRRIVADLLTFSRKSKPLKREWAVVDIADKALRLAAHTLSGESIVVERSFPAVSPRIVADAVQIEQVFLNLITNAAQAMRGCAEKRLHVAVTASAGRVGIEFRDTGPGISPQHLERLFEPFFTTKPPGEGTGLGLSVCHGIVSEHGGAIVARSREGAGTTFKIELPAAGMGAEP